MLWSVDAESRIYVVDVLGLRHGELHPITAQCHLHCPPGAEAYLVGAVRAGQLLERGRAAEVETPMIQARLGRALDGCYPAVGGASVNGELEFLAFRAQPEHRVPGRGAVVSQRTSL